MVPSPTAPARAARTRLRGRWPLALIVLFAALVPVGCATLPAAPAPDYDVLAGGIADGEPVDLDALREAFLAQPDFAGRLHRLVQLEAQAKALEERPLRLGALGSAALDLYYGSLVGHRAQARFYREVGNEAQAAFHDAQVAAISAEIDAAGAEAPERRPRKRRDGEAPDGTQARPYRVLFVNQAQAFLAEQGLEAVGSVYHETPDAPLMLWVAARQGDGRARNIFFDLSPLYERFAAAVAQDPDAAVFPIPGPAVTCRSMPPCAPFSPSAFVHALARNRDDAAQTLIGRTLVALGDRWDDAANWLLQAAQSGNAVANLTLGEVCLALSSRRPQQAQLWLERAENRLQIAVDAGFEAAMVQLAGLYRRGVFGAEKRALAVPLFERAAQTGSVDALVVLGWLHAVGEDAALDHDLAERYLVRAAELDDEGKVQYARFLLSPLVDRGFNERAYGWLKDVAANDDPQAMLLIAKLYHKGVHLPKHPRRARGWMKKAVKAAPDDAHVVNEVAWTLTVTRMPRLRDERYALRIMERVMADADNEARHNPAYLDTWAAAYAANGDFERAISVQQEAIAIEQAKSQRERSDVDVLLEHLAAFRAGELVYDEAVP